MKSWKERLMALPVRLVEYCSRKYWVGCQIPSKTIVMGFTTIDKFSSIGNYTFINRFCEITRSSIGNYCSIGSGVRIGSGEHDYKLPSTSSFITKHVAEDLTSRSYALGHDVWVGTQSFIRRGVAVGTGAVIGANAVVVNDVPDYAIVVGNPARVVKYRFDETIIEELMVSLWWQKLPEEACEVLNGIISGGRHE